MAPEQLRETGDIFLPAGLAKATGGGRGEELLGEDLGEEVVHAGDGIAHRHGAEGVAVVARPDRQQPMTAKLAPGLVILEGHLDSHLHRHRARIAQEDVLEGGRGEGHQTLDQPDRRFVGQAPEHDMGHGRQLVPEGLIEDRVVVTVNGAPPRGHAIDEFPPVHELKAAAPGGAHRIDRVPVQGRGIGMPGVGLVDGQQFFNAAHGGTRTLAGGHFLAPDWPPGGLASFGNHEMNGCWTVEARFLDRKTAGSFTGRCGMTFPGHQGINWVCALWSDLRWGRPGPSGARPCSRASR